MANKLFGINPNKTKEQREIGKSGVEAQFVTAVAKCGWKAYKFTSEMNRGVSDRLVIAPGQVWFVEIKRKSGELSPLQESFRDRCLMNNLNHFIVYGKDGIKDFIKEVKKNAQKQ